ncbi:MAG TPA: hypothetical protein VFN67_20485 [Polyangiales bacterium]|nr:hypothetical protein [Polyangiales bacterium]
MLLLQSEETRLRLTTAKTTFVGAACLSMFWLAVGPGLVVAEPPPEPDTAQEIEDHRKEAADHAAQAKEHAAEAIKHQREEVRVKLKELREVAREQRDVMREEIEQARVTARESLHQAGQQLKAAGQAAHEQMRGAREAVHESLLAGKAELKGAGVKLNQEFAVLRERAQEARARVWAQWRAKLRSREAIDARIQREFEKHARREAKFTRIETVAREAKDNDALDRAARLRARESERHETRMRRLTDAATQAPGAQP